MDPKADILTQNKPTNTNKFEQEKIKAKPQEGGTAQRGFLIDSHGMDDDDIDNELKDIFF